MDAGLLPPCKWAAESKDEYGCVPFHTFAAALDSCAIGPLDGGLCFTMQQEIRDKHNHILDGDYDPKGANGCDHQDTDEWKAEHMGHKHKHHDDAPAEDTVSVTAPPEQGETTTTAAPVLLAGSGLPAMPDASDTTASVSVDQAVAQVKSLAPEGASPALMIGGAAVLAVVGGAIKFGPQVLKSRHEARMKELELKQEQQSKEDDKHGQCNVARAALEAKVVALESKIAGLESKKSDEFGLGDIDFGDLKDRLEKLEKTVAPPKKRGRPAKGKA
jgi:hypothetical protein